MCPERKLRKAVCLPRGLGHCPVDSAFPGHSEIRPLAILSREKKKKKIFLSLAFISMRKERKSVFQQ